MEKIIRADTCVLTWGTGFLTSSRLDFFITVGSQGMLPARTDPKPEYAGPCGAERQTRPDRARARVPALPPPDLPTAYIALAAKKCEKLLVFCHPAIASCNIYCTAQSTQIRPAVHGRRTVKKTCHARVWRCNTFLAVRCKRFNCISGKKECNKKYRQDTAENGRINVQKFINLHWSQSVISCQKH